MKKRKLKLPFRIILNLSLVIIILIISLFGVYKYFIEDELKSLTNAYQDNIYDKDLGNKLDVKNSSYTIAILGVDEDLGSSRTDSISLMAVNPIINEVNIYSVPRDAYVQYNCIDDYSDKITNAHSYGGVECTFDALENIFNTEIDFYVKLDFSGFISIIDQLGSIQTEVPDFYGGSEWCEQTSNRVDEICFSEFGTQRINSEQALAIARSRQHSSDIDRNVLQKQIITDTIKEILTIRDLKQLESLVVSLQNKVMTNISTKQATTIMYNMYNFNKEDKEINSYQIEGEARYDYGTYVGYGSYFIMDTESLQKTREDLDKFLNAKE